MNGPITYTPDLLPMVGPTLLPDMWLAVGFGYGIGRFWFFFDNFVVICIDNVFSVHGGGVGKYLADWICEGEAPYELNEFDPLRFSSSWTSSWTSSLWQPTKIKIFMIIVRASFSYELLRLIHCLHCHDDDDAQNIYRWRNTYIAYNYVFVP